MGRMEAAREQRLADAKARRATPEFAAAGEQLMEQRLANQLAEEARQRAANEQRVVEYWQRQTFAVSASTLDRHRRGFARALADAAADAGQEPDAIALDVLDGYMLATLGSSRRSMAIALELLRCEFGMGTAEGLAHVRRIGGGR